jgi:hypothetical protein
MAGCDFHPKACRRNRALKRHEYPPVLAMCDAGILRWASSRSGRTPHSAACYADTHEMPRRNRQRVAVPAESKRPSGDSRPTVLDPDERALLKSVERGEWTPVARVRAAKARHARFAKASLQRLRKAQPHRKAR